MSQLVYRRLQREHTFVNPEYWNKLVNGCKTGFSMRERGVPTRDMSVDIIICIFINFLQVKLNLYSYKIA